MKLEQKRPEGIRAFSLTFDEKLQFPMGRDDVWSSNSNDGGYIISTFERVDNLIPA